LTAWCDNTGESLTFLLRSGRAGSNTASDHITVLTEAIAQIPPRRRRDLLVTVDGAGATLELIRHISTLNTGAGRRVHYSVGFDLDARARAAIAKVTGSDWQHVSDRAARRAAAVVKPALAPPHRHAQLRQVSRAIVVGDRVDVTASPATSTTPGWWS
jgi:hypothetical protein